MFVLEDVDGEVVYELFVNQNRLLRLQSPAGGLGAAAINQSTGVTVPNNGTPVRVEVSALRNDSVVVRVDGVQKLNLTGLSGATTGNPRSLLVGIDEYAGTSTQPVTIYHAHVGTSTTDWLGAPGGGGDTTPPGVPAGLGGTATSATSVDLNWNDVVASDLAGYNVYRSSSESGTYTKLNGPLVSLSQYTDASAPAGATSWYKVTAVDTTGNESAQSTATSVTTPPPPDSTPPGVPAGLGGTATSPTSVDLNWSDVSASDLAGYNVFRSSSEGGTYTKLNGPLVSLSQYTDASAPVGATSWYKVSSVDTTGNESAQSVAVSVTTPPGGGGGMGPYEAFTIDSGCGACALVYTDPELRATIAGAGANVDTAFATDELGGAAGLSGRVFTRSVVRLEPGQTLAGQLYVFVLEDVDGEVVYELFVNQNRLLRLQSPAGGLGAAAINQSTGVTVPNNGTPVRVEVSALRNDSVVVRVDGVQKLNLTGLSGATTGNPRSLLVGIDEYAGTSTQPVTIYHAHVGTSTTDWLGAPGGVPPDVTAPATPTGLSANATGPTTVVLDWSDNGESDLAGYNVYRSASLGGTYTKLNGPLVTSSQYTDTSAPANATSYYKVSAVDTTGNESAQSTAANTTTPAPPGGGTGPYEAFVTDAGCAGCTLAWNDPELQASIAGGADGVDTAYGVDQLGTAAGLAGRVFTRTLLRFPAGQTVQNNLAVLQLRDTTDALVYEIYVSRTDRTVRLYSPAGGLRSTAINLSTGVVVPNDGTSSVRVEVSALRNSSVIVRVDGVDKITLTGLAGATSGNPRFLRAGIDHYDGTATAQPKTVFHAHVGASATDWLGAP